jgi:hypothetical protein
MAVIGFRCAKDALTYVVLDGTTDEPVVVEHRMTTMPKTDRASQLVWLRREVHEILERTGPDAVAFKAAESIARTKDLARAECEGVLQEAVRVRELSPVRLINAKIKSELDFERPAKYLDSLLVGPLAALPKNRQEAALAALAALSDA